MTLAVSDLKLAAARLEMAAQDQTQPILQESLLAEPWLVRVVRVAPGARFLHLATAATMALPLSGLGTLEVDDWRTTVLPGQLVSVKSGQQVALRADGDTAAVMAIIQMEAAPAPVDEADEAS